MAKEMMYSSLLYDWKDHLERKLAQGIPKWRVYKELSNMYKISPYTIRGYLEREKKRFQDREWSRKKREGIRKNKKYDFWYHKLIRHIPDFLDPIFSDVDEVDIDYVAGELRKLADDTPFTYRMAKKVIDSYNRMIEDGEIRGPPINEVTPGHYRMSKT